jgi:cytochrome oxidase assembly protein ShyY1
MFKTTATLPNQPDEVVLSIARRVTDVVAGAEDARKVQEAARRAQEEESKKQESARQAKLEKQRAFDESHMGYGFFWGGMAVGSLLTMLLIWFFAGRKPQGTVFMEGRSIHGA